MVLLPLSSLLGDYAFGSVNSKQETLTFGKSLVTKLYYSHQPATQRSDSTTVLGMQNQDITQAERHQSPAWQILKYPQIISHNKWMPSTLKTESKAKAQVSVLFNREITFKIETDHVSCLSKLFP